MRVSRRKLLQFLGFAAAAPVVKTATAVPLNITPEQWSEAVTEGDPDHFPMTRLAVLCVDQRDKAEGLRKLRNWFQTHYVKNTSLMVASHYTQIAQLIDWEQETRLEVRFIGRHDIHNLYGLELTDSRQSPLFAHTPGPCSLALLRAAWSRDGRWPPQASGWPREVPDQFYKLLKEADIINLGIIS